MVDRLKQMQRADPVARDRWSAYVAADGDNIRDLAKHDLSFIEGSITECQAGVRLESNAGKEFVECIKRAKRKSPPWKQRGEVTFLGQILAQIHCLLVTFSGRIV